MPQDIAIAIIINLILILVFSWAFFLVMLYMNDGKAKKAKTSKKLAAADDSKKTTAVGDNKAASPNGAPEISFLDKLRAQKQQQIKQAAAVGSRIETLNVDDQNVRQLAGDINQLESELQQSLDDINQQVTNANPAGGQEYHPPADDNAELTSLQMKLTDSRTENLDLRKDNENLNKQISQLKHYRAEHREMSDKVAQYIEQNRKNVRVITNLKYKLDAAQLAADEARAALAAADGDSNDEALQAALAKAEQERQALETQYNELLGQLEDAEKISEELERSQKECAQLEDAYLALVAELEQEQMDFAVENEDPDFADDDFGKPSKTNPITAASAAMNVSAEALNEIADYNENWLSNAAPKAG